MMSEKYMLIEHTEYEGMTFKYFDKPEELIKIFKEVIESGKKLSFCTYPHDLYDDCSTADERVFSLIKGVAVKPLVKSKIVKVEMEGKKYDY